MGVYFFIFYGIFAKYMNLYTGRVTWIDRASDQRRIG